VIVVDPALDRSDRHEVRLAGGEISDARSEELTREQDTWLDVSSSAPNQQSPDATPPG